MKIPNKINEKNGSYIRCDLFPSRSENLRLGLWTVLPSRSIVIPITLSKLINSPLKINNLK